MFCNILILRALEYKGKTGDRSFHVVLHFEIAFLSYQAKGRNCFLFLIVSK
jgi:hypothetical protein